MSTASGANPRTCRCSSGSRRTTTGNKSTEVSTAVGGVTRLVGGLWICVCVSTPWMGSFQLSRSCSCPSKEMCSRYSTPGEGTSEPRTAQCRHHTKVFAIGISHTVFFLDKETERLCQQHVNLSQHCKMSFNHRQTTETCLLVMALLLVLAQ